MNATTRQNFCQAGCGAGMLAVNERTDNRLARSRPVAGMFNRRRRFCFRANLPLAYNPAVGS